MGRGTFGGCPVFGNQWKSERLLAFFEKFSVGELENECLKIIGKAAISGEFAYKNPAKHKFGMSVGGKSPESTANKPYGSLFDDFEK